MLQKTKFKDALDYIFIANDSGSNSYLITSNSHQIATANRTVMTNSTISGSTAVISGFGGGGGRGGINAGGGTTASAAAVAAAATATVTAAMLTTVTTTTTTTTTTSANVVPGGGNVIGAAVSSSSSSALSAAAAAAAAVATDVSDENFYSGVAVGLGAMLINDTALLVDVNGTAIELFGEIVNGSDLTTLNGTGNTTTTDDDLGEFLQMAATSVILGLMILITIIGNVFVIAAIILERNLQNVANYLVASLAVADLFVACLVMPLGAVYEISQGWILGPELCDIWTSCDVLCCTASILHLVAIAVDRYWAVTNIDYIHSRTSRRVFLMIFFVWSAAVIVSLAPQFGWKDPDYLQRIEQQKCMVSQDVSYQVFATCCTFYVPLLVILVLYWKIYQTARKRIHRRRPRPLDVTANNNQPDLTAPHKKHKRLRLRIGKFSGEKGNVGGKKGTTLGLVEGNSTNTVNTVEDTEFSSSNVDSKSRAGIEVTTAFSNPEEVPTTSTSQVSNLSHLVALANQQHVTSSSIPKQQQQQQQQNAVKTTTHSIAAATAAPTTTPTANEISTIAVAVAERTTTATTTTTPTTEVTATTNKVSIVTPNNEMIINNGCGHTIITHANGGAEVLEDPHLQQQLQQVQDHAAAVAAGTATIASENSTVMAAGITRATTGGSGGGGGGGGGATTSNATTITSISALSPQTPPAILPSSTSSCMINTAGQQHQHQQQQQLVCSGSSVNVSRQVTPTTKPKHQQQQQQQLASISNPMHKVTKRKETLEAKRERKAAKTLAIITGAFVVCWLPFFVMALMLPLCAACQISDGIASLFLWLGYFNSTLNPVIYTIFSPEFRQAFKRILFGGHRPVHYRSGKI